MKVGSTVAFTYKNQFGSVQQGKLTLTNNIVPESELSDMEVYETLCKDLKQYPLRQLLDAGYIFAARNLLKQVPKATEINMKELGGGSRGGGGDAGAAIVILAVLAIIVAIICFPLLVMLGMHNKLFLKGFYNKYESDEFKDFVKKYTYVGIGLYALVVVLMILGNVIPAFVLNSIAIYLLFLGGIGYFAASLWIIKKKFAPEDEKLDIIGTLKSAFKKKEKKD